MEADPANAMEQLEFPDPLEWDERRLWFERLERERSIKGTSKLSEQACALMIDLQTVFCAGAWAATIILAATIAEGQALWTREELDPALREELAWLRQLRNALLHEDPVSPILTVEEQWMNRKHWEREARRAVEVAVIAIYAAGGEVRGKRPGARKR